MVCKDEKETAIVKSNNCCENLVLQLCVGKKTEERQTGTKSLCEMINTELRKE